MRKVTDRLGLCSKAAAFAAALFLCLGVPGQDVLLRAYAEGTEVSAQSAGSWQQDARGWWYRNPDGSYPKMQWQEIDGERYYFDRDGYLVTNGFILDGGLTYIVDADGRMLRSTEVVKDGTAYVIREDGHAVTRALYEAAQGISQLDQGSDQTGWISDETGFRYKDGSGAILVDAWEQIDGTWYYFNSGGYMATESLETFPDGRLVYLGEDGKPVKDTELSIDGAEYVANSEGFLTVKAPPKSENEIMAESMAADIVSHIANSGMTKAQKANAIYNWLRSNMTYTTSGPQSDEAYSALYGFRRHSGCCYEYYAMAHYMLEAAGMPNIPVVRASDRGHYWNLVNVDGVWYHFDATPRRLGGRWCLVTTSYLQRNSWGSHNFDIGAYPQTPA